MVHTNRLVSVADPAAVSKVSAPNLRGRSANHQDILKSVPHKTTSDKTTPPDSMYDRDRVLHHLGIQLLDASEGHAVVQVTVAEQHLNGLGVGHGGTLFTLADAAMAYASNSGLPIDQQALATGGSIDFLAPARVDATVTARATTVAVSGRTSVHDVQVTADDGTLLAVFRGRTRRVGPPAK